MYNFRFQKQFITEIFSSIFSYIFSSNFHSMFMKFSNYIGYCLMRYSMKQFYEFYIFILYILESFYFAKALLGLVY